MADGAQYWIALCWDRVPAGPAPGGPPWLFLLPEHAEQYAGQLRARGIRSEVRSWTAHVTEHAGTSLICYPTIPAPVLSESETPAATNHADNGATTSAVLPPPSLE